MATMLITWVAEPEYLLETLLKLGLAAVLGGIIGWERERHGRPAGVRTHMLIVMGCTLLTEISREFGSGDPSRIAAQIVTGIGFLGAGAIMRRGGEVRGLTTAASVWIAAAIGMAIGVGGDFYWIALATTLLALLTLGVMDLVMDRFLGTRAQLELEIVVYPSAPLASVFASLDELGLELVRSHRSTRPDGVHLEISVSGDRQRFPAATERLASLPEVKSVARDPT